MFGQQAGIADRDLLVLAPLGSQVEVAVGGAEQRVGNARTSAASASGVLVTGSASSSTRPPRWAVHSGGGTGLRRYLAMPDCGDTIAGGPLACEEGASGRPSMHRMSLAMMGLQFSATTSAWRSGS